MKSTELTGEGEGKEGLPNLGGLGRLGMPILQESSELRPQQLGGASECGVQGAEGLEHKDDVGDGKQAAPDGHGDC